MSFTNGVLRRYVRWVTDQPRLVIGAITVVAVLLGAEIRKLRIFLDPDRTLPASHPVIVLGNRITDVFGGKYVLLVSLEVKQGDVFNPTTLAKVQRITKKIGELPGVIPGNLLSLSAKNVKDIVGSAEGMQIDRVMPEIPRTAEAMEALRGRVHGNDIMNGLLVSADGKMTSVLSDYSSMEKLGGFSGLYRRIQEIAAPEQDANTEIHLAGLPVSLHWMGVYSGRMRFVFPLAMVTIALLLFFAFRTGQGVAIPLLTALLSVAWSMGMMGLLHIDLDPFNLMTPILILAVAAGHSVQILKRYYEEYGRLKDNKAAVIESTTQVGVAMLTAGLVAAAGFASLVTFKTTTIRAFGLLTASGIVAALIIEMTFIPALRVLLAPPGEEKARKESRRTIFDPLLEGISARIRAGKGGAIIGAFAVILIAAVALGSRVRTDNSLSALFSKGSPVIRDTLANNARMAGAYVMQVLVEGREPDALKDPQALRDMEALQEHISGLPNVGKAISLVDFMRKMNKAMHADDPAQEVLPATKDLVAQYLLLYSMSGDPGDFDRVVDFDYQRAVITIYVKKDNYAAAGKLMADIDDYVRKNLSRSSLTFQVGGGISNGIALSDVIIHGKVQNILQVSAIIFLAGCLVFWSILGGFLVLLPLIVAVLFNFGVMGASGIWLSISTATISAMALGIGADYAIYFLFRYREEMSRGADWDTALHVAMTTSGKAVLFVASSISLGYVCLVFSGFLIHIYLGVLVPTTMVVSSVGALTLLPALVHAIKPRFVSKLAPARTADPGASKGDGR